MQLPGDLQARQRKVSSDDIWPSILADHIVIALDSAYMQSLRPSWGRGYGVGLTISHDKPPPLQYFTRRCKHRKTQTLRGKRRWMSSHCAHFTCLLGSLTVRLLRGCSIDAANRDIVRDCTRHLRV